MDLSFAFVLDLVSPLITIPLNFKMLTFLIGTLITSSTFFSASGVHMSWSFDADIDFGIPSSSCSVFVEAGSAPFRFLEAPGLLFGTIVESVNASSVLMLFDVDSMVFFDDEVCACPCLAPLPFFPAISSSWLGISASLARCYESAIIISRER